MKLLWKVCGMREEQNIADVLALEPDFMGFIFYPKSKRYAGNRLLLTGWENPVKKVGVFVNESTGRILEICKTYSLDYVQLHGQESPADCQVLNDAGIHIIKAFSVDESFDFSTTFVYEGLADYFLFDTKAPGGYGGHGHAFDWNLLTAYQGKTPFLLAGGIDENNVTELKNVDFPLLAGIDVNSRFEDAVAVKNKERLQILKKQLELF